MKTQELAGSWKLLPDADNHGRLQEWFKTIQKGALEASVPGIIQQIFPDYHGVAWYWHTFRPEILTIPGNRYLLRFGAVDYLAEVWLNGIPVGSHEGGETPFILDVTEVIQPCQDNFLAVRVLNPTDEPIDGITLYETPRRHKEVKKYMPGRSYNYGGILQPVELLMVPEVRISDIFVRPDSFTGEIKVAITIINAAKLPVNAQITVSAGAGNAGEILVTAATKVSLLPGENIQGLTLRITRPRLWDMDAPYLYQVTAAITADSEGGNASFEHQQTVRAGFRDFRVERGYFRLNGRRIFLRSTHTVNHFPIGQIVPHNSDFMRRDIVYAKATGFNMVRFIAGMAFPEQLDFCDEIGLMVYEESLASWGLKDSSQMAERYNRSIREMILRDRNHPSITIWGLLNEETPDGPVFRQAVGALPMVRAIDTTRLVLLNSGRWDNRPDVGSLSNPGGTEWEYQWGTESPDAPPVIKQRQDAPCYADGLGDVHFYPQVPHPAQTFVFLRTLGHDTKPVFLSEYGIGSLLNAIREEKMCQQAGARPDLPDVVMMRSMADKLRADWQRFGFDGVYPFPEDMLRESQRLHAQQRLRGFDVIRSNPKICGFNITGMLDHGLTGEGLWTFWREWKPGIVEALKDGWSALRWCLFIDPLHGYTGHSIKIEAVLANEDVLPPGDYPASFRILGPTGIVWERCLTVNIPKPLSGDDGPLAVPVLREEVVLDGPAGEYIFAANLERGGAPANGRILFRLASMAALPQVKGPVVLWGIDKQAEAWLLSRNIRCQQLEKIGRQKISSREVILVGVPANAGPAEWRRLTDCMERGGTVVFLDPMAFKYGDDDVHWLPLAKKGRCYEFNDWLYHKECVAKLHPVFDGLQGRGIMDWDYYGSVIPHYLFDGQDAPEEVMAAAFAVGYSCPGGYASGVLIGSYAFGRGRFILNTLRILENLGRHPAAGRLLLNLILEAQP